jgi:hypothetical protein
MNQDHKIIMLVVLLALIIFIVIAISAPCEPQRPFDGDPHRLSYDELTGRSER